MPTVRLPGTEVLPVGTAANVASDMIDFRFEDWPLAGKKPPLGSKNFAAPLSDGRWINIHLDNLGFGTGVIDQQIHNASNPKELKFQSYQKLDPDWSKFAEFLYKYRIVKPAEFEKERRGLQTGS